MDENKINSENYLNRHRYIGSSQEPSFLSTLDKMKSSKLQELLIRIYSATIYIHKLQIDRDNIST